MLQLARKALILLGMIGLAATVIPDGASAAPRDIRQSYEYDAAGRLIEYSSNGTRITYEYDSNGNLLYRINESLNDGRYKYSEIAGQRFDAAAGYSNTQGKNNWYYQERDGTAYRNLQYTDGQWRGSYPYTLIGTTLFHPDQTDAVRKWVAPTSGMIKITGNAAKENATCGDGVIASVLKNNNVLWTRHIEFDDTAGYDLNVVAGVKAGDAIYFVVSKNGNESCDGTNWSP